jgi:hypothetical protein
MGANQNSSRNLAYIPKSTQIHNTRNQAALRPVMLHLPCHGVILRVKKKSNRAAKNQPEASGENQLKTGGACYEEKNRTSNEPSQFTKPAARPSKRSRSPRGTTQSHWKPEQAGGVCENQTQKATAAKSTRDLLSGKPWWITATEERRDLRKASRGVPSSERWQVFREEISARDSAAAPLHEEGQIKKAMAR